jgi:hypothetical protein
MAGRDDLLEGRAIGDLAVEVDEPYTLTVDEAAQINKSIEDMAQGRFVDGDVLLRELDRDH